MALFRAKRSEMPADAVLLSEEDALKYQVNIMHKWKNKSETFCYRKGVLLLTTFGGLAGIYINNYYRNKFRLRRIGAATTYIPIVALPATLSFLFHAQFVLPDVTLQKSCAICTELRASAFQAFSGSLLPTILAPLSALSLAVQYNTYDVPYITKEPLKVLKIIQKLTRPAANTLFGIFVGQALLASIVTFYESKDVFKVSEKLAKLEFELEHGVHPPSVN
ncbi:uncharacterized protein [Onthophagus taurus]|uniref:uncharacterized protein n=1 Tax=Onthophagus taurus TaxID=166361 RepID=UPI0039BECAB5